MAPLGSFAAEDKIVSGKLVVSFVAADKQRAWVVNALEDNVYNDLSGYGRMVPFKKLPEQEIKCSKRARSCLLAIYKNAGVDALMLGLVDLDGISYEVYDVQNNSLVNRGSIKVGKGSSLLKLRMGAFDAFKPFIEKGGILDRRKFDSTEMGGATVFDQSAQEAAKSETRIRLLIFLAVLSCFPYLFSFLGKPLRHPQRSRIVLRWFFPFLLVCLALLAYQYTLESTGQGTIFHIALRLSEGYHWLLTGLGGAIWGFFFIINYQLVSPHLQGIERIRPKNILPVLQACLYTLLIKSLILSLFYVGFFYGVYQIGLVFALNTEVIILLLFPLTGLYVLYWARLVLDVLSMSLDVKLTGGKPDYNDVWNLKVRKYFIGYLKRNGITLNRRLVDDVVFLAGENKGVICYGGGFSRPRIAIDKELIKFSLGDIDDFNPQSTVVYRQKTFGPVSRQESVFQLYPDLVPKERKGLFKSRSDKKRARHLEAATALYQRDLDLTPNPSQLQLDSIMEGIVFPKLEGDDDFPSLMSDNLSDRQIVAQLLIDNSFKHGHYDEEAEVDDSSEHDRDFLFGALLQKFGGLLRHDDIFSTLYFYLRYKKDAKRRPYNFLLSKYFSIVADTFVVLNFGLNHLMQHLYFQTTKDATPLTTKGADSDILKSQDDILTKTKQLVSVQAAKFIQTDELERLVWLSRFCQDSIETREKNTQGQRLVRWAFSLSALYIFTLVVIHSYNYNSYYEQLIEQEKQAIAKAIESELDDGNKND